jgi:uncharacterized damage-inducible protein DinB
MDLLDRFLGHDAWTTREMLLRCRHLSDEQLDRDFDIGHRTLRRTFIHIVWNMEVWTDVMNGVPQRPNRNEDPAGRSIDGLIERLDVVAEEFAELATRITREGRLDEIWVDTLDDPPTTKSYGAAIAHVITHSMHHRAQVLYLMRLLGVKDLIEGDVLSWENEMRRTEPG